MNTGRNNWCYKWTCATVRGVLQDSSLAKSGSSNPGWFPDNFRWRSPSDWYSGGFAVSGAAARYSDVHRGEAESGWLVPRRRRALCAGLQRQHLLAVEFADMFGQSDV